MNERKEYSTMRKRLKNLKHKSGHSENGSPRSLIDECVYRSNMNHNATGAVWSPVFSGWSNGNRPRDFAIFLRTVNPSGPGEIG